MGTDNLHHKRKAKSARALARNKAKRQPYAKVLIVCEGEKTEPSYFNDLKDYYSLNSANVEICGDCGSDPMSVLVYAKQRYRQEKDAGDAFDKVYCVFDKDSHVNYAQALAAISSAAPKGIFEAITSVPCFEYWLLLHFFPTTRPYAQLPGASPADQLIDELRRYLPGYTKGQKGLFARLIDQLAGAKVNAERALQIAERSQTDNPSTRVHQLVTFLQQIKEP